MRFNCQSCQAKYQIADEKVAGKTVRMKCRKCSALIQVRAQTGGGGMEALYVPSSGPGGPPPKRPVAPAPRASAPGPPRPGGRPSGPGAPRPRPSGPGGPPRPAGAQLQRGPLPGPSRPGPLGSGPAAAHTNAAPSENYDDESTVIMQRPDIPDEALSRPRPAAGAQPPKAAATPAPARALVAAPKTDADWYVGIAGEPVGPIDVAYIKTQVDAGKVTGESLVWREELTDWKPLRTFDELRALVPAPADAASDPVALTRVKDEDTGSSAAAALLAAGGAEPARPGAPPPATTAGEAPLGEPRLSSIPPDSIAIERAAGLPDRRKRRRGMHPMAWAFIAMAAAFGGVAAFVLLTSETGAGTGPNASGTTPTTGPSGATTVASGQGSAPAPTGTAIELAQVDVNQGSSGSGAGTRPSSGGSNTDGSGKPSSSDPPRPKPCKPDDPFCDSGPSGPSAGSKGSNGNGSGQGLSQGQVQGVVNRNRRAVSRKCMSYVTGKKGGGSAKVFVSLTVGASGAVQSVSASGGKGYPGLASCVRSRVANWTFPQAGASTKVNVPFHFLAQ